MINYPIEYLELLYKTNKCLVDWLNVTKTERLLPTGKGGRVPFTTHN